MIAEDSGSLNIFGLNMLEEEIDTVIFQTNSFLCNGTFIAPGGPFFMILNICLGLATIFALIVAGNMGFKMMVKKEGIDVLKLLRPMAIALVLFWWYPPSVSGRIADFSGNWCVLDFLSYIPNALGSYTRVLYQAEAEILQTKFDDVQEKLLQRDDKYKEIMGQALADAKINANMDILSAMTTVMQIQGATQSVEEGEKAAWDVQAAGVMMMLDKLIMTIALIIFRIGWWGTIYIQQIMLAVLTIFGPLHWAFSILPKYESSWSKWLGRYLTIHMYGAMLYFVGFYVLLLFDICMAIQLQNLDTVLSCSSGEGDSSCFFAYLKNCCISSGYMMASSVVSLKALAIVPDIASFVVPEGEVAFSARSFGEGIAEGVRGRASSGSLIA